MPDKKYCNITIEIFSKSKDNKGSKQARNKLEKLVEKNFDEERKKCVITMDTTYPF